MSNYSRGYPVPQIVLLILVAYLFALNLFMIFPTSLSPLKDHEMWLYLISILQILWWSILLRNLGRTSLPSGLGNECHKGNIDTKLFIDGNTLPATKSKSVIQILQLLYFHVFKSGGDICYFLLMCAPCKAIILVSVSRVDGCSSPSTSNGDLGSSSSDSDSDTSSDGELEGASSILGMALLKNKGIQLYRTESKKSRELCKSITIVFALIVPSSRLVLLQQLVSSLWVIMGLQKLLEKAHSAIVLSLGDTVLREVAKAKSAVELWLKLESLYMTKSLIILDLENIDIAVSDEDKAIMLLTSLDASYTNMKEAIMYGRDNMTFDEVQLENYKTRRIQGGKRRQEFKFRSKPKTKKFKVMSVILDGYDVEVECGDGKDWILDSGCSFHMCPIKAWFEDFKEADGGHVLLGNNKQCKILGQTVTSKVSTVLKEDMGTTKLWGLQELEKQGVLGNYKLTNMTFCEHCVFGKTTRVKFAKVVHETQNQLDYIHFDLWGPSWVLSIGGARSPSSALQFKTPQEKWVGKAADYQHLKVFGCTTYVHTKTNKLEPRAVKCIFLGYPKGCIITRDVTFNEQDMSKQTPAKYVEGQDEPTQGLESYSLARDNIAEEIVDMEPKTYQEAINSNEADQWVKAIQEEMDSLRKNETWELVTKPRTESSIRLLLAFVAHEDLELDQLDVKTTFLHGELDELIYMQPPEGFGEGIKDGQVCLLKKSLYGLKQSPRLWYKRFDKYMLDIGFNRSSHDGCVYFKPTEDNMVYLLLYVDDIWWHVRRKDTWSKLKRCLRLNLK
ncbi:hypothetical protein AAG906_021489 [Vitis piasezkii]